MENFAIIIPAVFVGTESRFFYNAGEQKANLKYE